MCPVKHNPGEKSSSDVENMPLCPLTGTDCYREYCMFWDEANETCIFRRLAFELIYHIISKRLK